MSEAGGEELGVAGVYWVSGILAVYITLLSVYEAVTRDSWPAGFLLAAIMSAVTWGFHLVCLWAVPPETPQT